MNLVLIDAITSIFAFIGCLLYGISMLQYRRFDILARRTGYLIACISAIFLMRFLLGVSEYEFFAKVLTFLPFCIPIFILVSVEGLIRRHAAQWLKILAFGSLSVGLITLFMEYAFIGLPASILAALLIVLTCAFCGGWVRNRMSQDLKQIEQGIARIYVATLFLMIPLILSDFTMVFDVDIRFGATGFVLVLFILLRTTIDNVNLKQAFLEIMFMVLFSLPVLFIGMAENFNLWSAVGIANMTIVMFAALGITVRVISVYIGGSRLQILQDLSKLDTKSMDHFVQGLKQIFDVRIIAGQDLSLFELGALEELFTEHPIVSQKMIKDLKAHSSHVEEAEQVEYLLRSYDATHTAMINEKTSFIMLFTMPPLGHETDTLARLNVVHKMASLIEKRATA